MSEHLVSMVVPVMVFARHVRLSAAHLEMLFGVGARLTAVAPLAHTGLVAAAETVELRGPQGALHHVRILGPLVKRTEVRLTSRDAAGLGIEGHRATHEIEGSPGCSIEGPHGTVVLTEGVLTGLRMLSLRPDEASQWGAGTATVTVHGEREREMRDVTVLRGAASWMMIDVDDANALEVGPNATATVAL